jgi:GNAT superfamily N-acetyltransferase
VERGIEAEIMFFGELRMSTDSITIREVEAADIPSVRRIFQQYAKSLPFDLGYQDFDAELRKLPYPYAVPNGILVVAEDSTRKILVGTAALKRLSDDIAEVKRVFVVDEARGRGVGHALLAQLIRGAEKLGFSKLRLDTHRATMSSAISLYKALGFYEIPPYGPDLDGALIFFERNLGSDQA